MRNLFAKPAAIALVYLSVGIVFAACRGPAPTSTPAPPTVNVPTPLPPAPTAPPLTEAPTAVPTAVLPTQVTIPTATPLTPSSVPTNAPGATTAPTSGAPATTKRGVYVTRLNVEPPTVRNKEAPTFFATFSNSTGKDENTTWCVEVFRPGEKKSFGITRCNLKTIPPGSTVQTTTGWEIAGVRECIPIVGRAVVRDAEDVRTPFKQPNGQDLWLIFNACP